ncbi:MAG: MurT ligase domain-containing protein [Oscillospiraceae bacterium]|nr:MurT ligase domain-containing protein [Oscillospiraceae bacterium]
MKKIMFYAALWIGKLARVGMRILGRNATFFPGVIALKICPEFLQYVGKPKTVVSVTGTNGKTTTVNLICDLLEHSGRRVLHNRFGTNINAGVAVALMLGCSLSGRPKYDIAVFETDERSAKRIYPYIQPTHIVITNLFRDSVMRNAHCEFISGILTEGIPPRSLLILNADDPVSSRVAPNNRRVYFGMKKLPSDTTECVNLLNDARVCPVCNGSLEYEYRRYHHIGKCRCAECGFSSPQYDYSADNVDFGSMVMSVSDKTGRGRYKLISDSVFNAYNILAAIALLRELGLSHEDIAGALELTSIMSSRYRKDKEGDVRVVMQFSKAINALAITRAFDYVASQPGLKQLLVIMNDLGDEKEWSENICWMYDCDFELLNKSDITRIVVAGPRVKDLYFRLLLAGIPKKKLLLDRDELCTPEMFNYKEKSDIYIFHGLDSYEVALKARDKIARYARSEAGV